MRRRKRREEEKPYALSLTSLMDIVTNILVYTIKIFAVSPIVVQDPSVELPHSTSREDAEESVVVMLTGMRDQQSPTIVVDGKVVEWMDKETYRVPESAKNNGYVIKKLKKELLAVRQNQKQSADLIAGSGFTGKVVIVADKHTPYRVLVDILVTCADAGFGSFEFAVVKQEA